METTTADKAVILDTETAKLDGNAVEIAYYPLELANGVVTLHRNKAFNQLFNPLEAIDLKAMAVHHILEQDIAEQPAHTTFKLSSDIEYIIGHNIDYDLKTLKRCGITQQLKPIDTLPLARRHFPNAPAHNLSVLSYYLARDKGKVRGKLRNAHSALTDIDLTAALLKHLVTVIPKQFTQTFEDLYLYSLECRVPVRMAFGEHKGKKIELIPDSYKQWLLKTPNLDVYLRFALELDQASHARRAFETRQNLKLGTFEDYQFIGSRTPVEANNKADLFDRLLQKSLELH